MNIQKRVLEPEVQQYMEYILARLPASDIDTYSGTLFEGFCRHAHMLKKTSIWSIDLDDEAFLQYVLYPRINDEDLSNHRALFYSEVYPRIQHLPIKQAVLEANRWCHEKVTYQQQDERTASPFTVFCSGSGRCGEESAFVVAVLRSVGIPARQIYAPRWSHCDDNHAWVEALCDGEWQYFGACEPEPVLDRGWFNTAASRAMLVHSRVYGKTQADKQLHGQVLDTDGIVTYCNQTARYAKTKRYSFYVKDAQGTPVSGAMLQVQVLNEAQYFSVATLKTNKEGSVCLEMGIGDIKLLASHGSLKAEGLCCGKQQSELVLHLLEQDNSTSMWKPFDFTAPTSSLHTAYSLTEAEKEVRVRTLENGNILRAKRLETLFDEQRAAHFPQEEDLLREARGNFANIYTFLNKDVNPLRVWLLRSLNKKDLRDVTDEILEDHLVGATKYELQYPKEVFEPYLLCPRIMLETLTVWRTALASAFTPEQKKLYSKSPEKLWAFLQDRLTIEVKQTVQGLYWPPEKALEAKRCDEKSFALLFVACLRAFGVPARITSVNNIPEYWDGNTFVAIEKEQEEQVVLIKKGQDRFLYRQNWSLSHWKKGNWHTLNITDDIWQENVAQIVLPVGMYRILSVARLPNGNQFAYQYEWTIKAQQSVKVELQLRKFVLEDMLTLRELPSFIVQNEAGEKCLDGKIASDRPFMLFLLEEAAEPTEHVLNELMEAKDGLKNLSADIFFFLRSKEAAQQPTLAKTLQSIRHIHLVYGDWNDTLETLAYHLHCDPERPPLAIVCDGKGNAAYATGGYNVGSVELIIQIVEHLHSETAD